MANSIQSFDDLFALFGGLADMSRELGHSRSSTAHSWKKAGSLPKWRYPEILSAAERLKLPVSEADLDRISGRVPTEGQAA